MQSKSDEPLVAQHVKAWFRVRPEKQFPTVKILLLFFVVVRLWQAYRDTVDTGVGVVASGDAAKVSCVQKKITGEA